MQLKSAVIRNYRSIEDSGEVSVEPDVTALVGKNESGKTAALQAMHRLNPIRPGDTYDAVVDFPSRHTRRRKEAKGPIPVCTATFTLSPSEVRQIEDELGPGVLTSAEFTVTSHYGGSRTYTVPTDETAAVRHLIRDLDLPASAADAVNSAATIAQLQRALGAISEPHASVTDVLGRVSEWRDGRLNLRIIDAHLYPRLPKFVYFDEYSIMPGKVSVPDLIRRREAGQLDTGERALLALFSLVGAKLEDFSDVGRHEHLIRELENAANTISDEVFEYWSQNRDLAVELSILTPEADAAAPLNEGPVLQVRVRNSRHRVTVPFDERSRGFVWFFSFLAYFSELEEGAEQDLVLLLDEPGLSLHATAQGDLLRFIDERLAPRHQVIYTTHSPFMLSPRKLSRARTVVDRDREGTKVSSEVFLVDAETAFPLQAALGYELAQTLFVAPDNLLLEGPSDMIYLDALDEAARIAGRPILDPEWVKVPVGGAGKLSSFVSLLGANKLTTAVLMDASTKDGPAVAKLVEAGKLRKHDLVLVSDAVGRDDADIEDLFEPEFYLELVNRAYADELTAPITIEDLPPGPDRIVRRVGAVFAQRGIDRGRLNHYRPAAALQRYQHELLPKLTEATLDRHQALVEQINRVRR